MKSLLPLPGKNLKLPLGLIGNPYLPHSPQTVQLQEAQKGEPFLISQQEALSSPYSFAGQDAGYAPPQSRRRHVLLDHGQQGQSVLRPLLPVFQEGAYTVAAQ